MDFIVSGVSRLPYSTVNGISISVLEAILLFLCMVLFFFFFPPEEVSFPFRIIGSVPVSGLSCGGKNNSLAPAIITVYNIPGKTAIAFISGDHCLMPFSKVDSTDIAMHIQYNWWKLGVKDNRSIPADTDAVLLSGKLLVQKQFVQFNNCRIAFIKNDRDMPSFSDKLNLNCVIVSGSYKLDMLSLKNAFNFDTLVFDSSVPDYKLKKWEAECKQLNLHYYNVKTQGAYIKNC